MAIAAVGPRTKEQIYLNLPTMTYHIKSGDGVYVIERGVCRDTQAEFELQEQNWVRAAHKKLGDPGRH
jgi:hypothetical protein